MSGTNNREAKMAVDLFGAPIRQSVAQRQTANHPRTEAVLDAKSAAVRLGGTVTVTRVSDGGVFTGEVEVTDMTTAYLSTRKAEVKA